MTLAVKVALNPNTTNQSTPGKGLIESLVHLRKKAIVIFTEREKKVLVTKGQLDYLLSVVSFHIDEIGKLPYNGFFLRAANFY